MASEPFSFQIGRGTRRIAWDDPEFQRSLPISYQMIDRVMKSRDNPGVGIDEALKAIMALESQVQALWAAIARLEGVAKG